VTKIITKRVEDDRECARSTINIKMLETIAF